MGGNRKALSHEELLGGRLAAKTSYTLNRTGRQQEEKLMGKCLSPQRPLVMWLLLLHPGHHSRSGLIV